MQFEFDKKKSNMNKSKHGIDFYKANKLWNDINYIEIPVKNVDEPRFIIIGKILGKYWSGIIMYRNKKIRIISVRRSRKKEVELYES